MYNLGKCLQSVFYVLAGVNHFINPDFYIKMIPPYLAGLSSELNILSGIIEIALGVLLIPPKTQRFAAAAIILMLFAFFPANIYLVEVGSDIFDYPTWFFWARLPLQFVLMYFAYIYYQPKKS